MTKVKICGITNSGDAAVALAAGADYLGFIFYPPSPRFISPESIPILLDEVMAHPQAGPIMKSKGRPRLVGVFVNETITHVATVLDRYGLDLAQLSGDEPPEHLLISASPLFGRAYKAVRPTTYGDAKSLIDRYLPDPSILSVPDIPQILVDTPHKALFGGTGETGDWHLSAALAKRIPGFMLAGGLTAANVAEAVSLVRPFAVDVASGVEQRPGIKDHSLVATFIRKAKEA